MKFDRNRTTEKSDEVLKGKVFAEILRLLSVFGKNSKSKLIEEQQRKDAEIEKLKKRVAELEKEKTADPAVWLERAGGIEPLTKAWEAFILPLNYARRS